MVPGNAVISQILCFICTNDNSVRISFYSVYYLHFYLASFLPGFLSTSFATNVPLTNSCLLLTLFSYLPGVTPRPGKMLLLIV